MSYSVMGIVKWIAEKSGGVQFARETNLHLETTVEAYLVGRGYSDTERKQLSDVFKHTFAAIQETYNRASDPDYVSSYGLQGAYTSVQGIGVLNEIWNYGDSLPIAPIA
jgi:hypothetical protein